MKVGHASSIRHMYPMEASVKKSKNPVINFFHKLFGIHNSNAEKKQQKQPEKLERQQLLNLLKQPEPLTMQEQQTLQKEQEELKELKRLVKGFEPRANYQRLTREEAIRLGQELKKKFNSDTTIKRDGATIQVLRRAANEVSDA